MESKYKEVEINSFQLACYYNIIQNTSGTTVFFITKCDLFMDHNKKSKVTIKDHNYRL